MPVAAGRPCAVFVLGLAPVKIGGMEKFLRLFVLQMDGAGWDTVLCFDGPVGDEFRGSVDFPSCTIEQLAHQGDLGFAASGALWRVLRRHRPQRFIYAFNGIMRTFPWLARLSGCREISFYDHSSRAPGFVARPLSLPKRIVGRVLTAPLKLIVSVAEFTRQTGTALGVSSAPNVVLTNGVEVQTPSPERGRALRERLGIPAEAVVFTQLCWMVPVKGVPTLLEAAAKTIAAVPQAYFLLVGDGPDLPVYREQAAALGIAERVSFTGVISNPTAQGIFEATDVYCQPSLWQEACPLAVLEAMSFRLPVVASHIGGLPELVRDGSTGFLFSPGDPTAMAGRLVELADNLELRHSLGEVGYLNVLSSHRIEDTVNRYVKLVLGTSAK
jgi:glycosyltransferase involved in cell wall biosynthesis